MQLSLARKRSLYLLFSLSGFCSLVYEILWTKYLSLSLGTTMIAISLVAATFMGGLAVGSMVIGRYSDRKPNLLAIYAVLEGLIALFALLFPPTLEFAQRFHMHLERSFPTYNGAEHLLHFFFVMLMILPPTFCMGGTFPLMCRIFARKKCGGQIGRLYALNTAGAMLGAFLSGYILIPTLGLSRTGWMTAAINLIIAGAAFALSCKTPIEVKIPHKAEPIDPPPEPARVRFTLIAIGLIGLFALTYEILWTRVLLLFLGNTTYAFGLILSAFLLGITIGGALYARLVFPHLDEKRLFVQLTLLMGCSVLVTAPFYDQLANAFLWAHDMAGDNWWGLTALSFVIVVMVMLLPTLLSGALLPAATALLQAGESRTGSGVGMVVLSNTIGAALGSLLAGFILIPLLGTEYSFRLIGILNLLLGLAVYLLYFRRRESVYIVAFLTITGLCFGFSPMRWNQKLMNAGVYCYASTYNRFGGIEAVTAPERILAVIEGKDSTVAIKEIDIPTKVRYFSVNGKTDGGNGGDMSTQILIGQLPLLLHPAPRNALVIGLGTGITLGAVAATPLEKIDCVEISAEVVKASRYFEKENRQVLQDPRVTLHIQDGRDLLQMRSQNYDTIISQPSNPWQTGNANLFTREFYQAVVKNLAPRGIFSQWIGLYDITPENLRIATRTLIEVFPHTLTFRINGDLIMLASFAPLNLDYQLLSRHFAAPPTRELLTPIGLFTPGDLLARHFVLNDGTLRSLSAGAEENTDDRPALEFSFRYNLGGKMFGKLKDKNIALLQPFLAEQLVPLSNLGSTPAELTKALRELHASYQRAGRNKEARFFMEKISDYEGSLTLSSPLAGDESAKNL
jgi:spermidine synthase